MQIDYPTATLYQANVWTGRLVAQLNAPKTTRLENGGITTMYSLYPFMNSEILGLSSVGTATFTPCNGNWCGASSAATTVATGLSAVLAALLLALML